MPDNPRQWPTPDRPWVMRQTWHDVLFMHWPAPVDDLRRVVPPQLPLDTRDGAGWLGIVPFRMSGVRLRLVPPAPLLSAFPELNVRTYVTIGGKPGVYFFSLDAANPLAVAAARRLDLLYQYARMSCEWREGWVEYESERLGRSVAPARLSVRYRPAGEIFTAEPGSLEDFLTARYCLYAVGPDRRVSRLEIDHAPWPLQPAAAEIRLNTMTAPLGLTLPGDPLLHFARRMDMVAWWPESVRDAGRVERDAGW